MNSKIESTNISFGRAYFFNQ